MPASITLSMIVRNEEKYLRDCLASVKDAVDEIVIVDTGSTDNTINIAKEFGAEVYPFQWIKDFSAARNFALSKSAGNWILYLDADERLSKNSLTELRELTSQDQAAGYKCIVRSLDDSNGKPHYMKYVRLFRNKEGIKFTGAVHEQIENSLIEKGYKIINTGIEIIHLGYNISKEEIEKKARRNLKLLNKEYESDRSAYNAFQLANTYSVLKEYGNAKRYYLETIEKGNLSSEYIGYAYLNISDYELKKHNINQALQHVIGGLRNDPASVLLKLLAADIYFRLNETEEAIKFCREALRINRENSLCPRDAELAVEVKTETIISKGIYFSFLAKNKDSLAGFLTDMKLENKSLFDLLITIAENKPLTGINDQMLLLVSEDNIDLFLILLENYNYKKDALEVLKRLEKRFDGNSKFHKTLGILFSESNLFNEAVEEYRKSLSSEEKDPSAVLYLISVLISNNRFEEIPNLLLYAEKEFGFIPEFAEKFKVLKEKLGILFPG